MLPRGGAPPFEENVTRPRQVRYQAGLRPDTCVSDYLLSPGGRSGFFLTQLAAPMRLVRAAWHRLRSERTAGPLLQTSAPVAPSTLHRSSVRRPSTRPR